MLFIPPKSFFTIFFAISTRARLAVIINWQNKLCRGLPPNIVVCLASIDDENQTSVDSTHRHKVAARWKRGTRRNKHLSTGERDSCFVVINALTDTRKALNVFSFSYSCWKLNKQTCFITTLMIGSGQRKLFPLSCLPLSPSPPQTILIGGYFSSGFPFSPPSHCFLSLLTPSMAARKMKRSV